MKIWVPGGKGQVGSEFCRQACDKGWEPLATGSDEVDITQEASVLEFAELLRPTLIVNAAAYTAVDKAESDEDRALAVNATGVLNIAKAAKALGVPVFHLSTDYVFDGTKKAPYLEKDTPNPQSVYGRSKLTGEQALIQTLAQYRIMRVSWVFGVDGHNFVKTMLRLGRERDELKVVDDQFGAPTSAQAISRALVSWTDSYLSNSPAFTWGLYHLPSSPGVTWFGFAQEVFKQSVELGLLEKAPKVLPISSEEFPTPVKRPENSRLGSTFEAQAELADDWKSSLRDVLSVIGDKK